MPKRNRWGGVLLLGVPLIFFITLKTHRTFSGDGDEPHYLLIAESLIDDHDLNMVNQYPDRHAFIPQLDPPGHTVPDRFGGTYPVHDLGLPVLLVPVLLSAHAFVPLVPEHVLSSLRLTAPKLTTTLLSYQSILVSCLLTWLLFIYFQQSGFSRKEAYGGAWLAVLTLPIATHAYLFFTEIYSATIIVGLLLLLKKGATWAVVAAFSLLLFVLLWLHTRNVLLCVGFILLWIRKRTLEGLGWASWMPLFSIVLAMASRCALNGHFLGHATLSAPLAESWNNQSGFSARFILHNAFGFLFDRQFGLIWSNPLFFLFPLGAYSLYRRQASWWINEVLLLVLYGGMLLAYRFWWGGWSPAGRMLVSIMPLLWVPVLAGFYRIWESGPRWLDYFLLFGSLFIAGVHWQEPRRFWMNETDGINPWMDLFRIGGHSWQHSLPSSFQIEPNHGLKTLLTLLVSLAVITVSFVYGMLDVPDPKKY